MKNQKPFYASNIHYLRNANNLTMKQAAAAAQITVSSWASYEDGRAFPHYTRLPNICRVLEFTDIVSLITKDLTNEKELRQTTSLQAIESISKLSAYFKNIKIEQPKNSSNSNPVIEE